MSAVEAIYFAVCVGIAIYGGAIAIYAAQFPRISIHDMKPKHPCPPEDEEHKA